MTKIKPGNLFLAAVLLFFSGCGGSGSEWWVWPVPAGTFYQEQKSEEDFFAFSLTVEDGEIIRGVTIYYGEDENCFVELYSPEPEGLCHIEDWLFSFPIDTTEVQGSVWGYFKTPYILEAGYQIESQTATPECLGTFGDQPRALRYERPSKSSFFPNFAPVVGIIRPVPGCRGLAWEDFDKDENIDLFSGMYMEGYSTSPELIGSRLYVNQGIETLHAFLEKSEDAGITDPEGQTTGCAWGDFNGDGLTDLYVCRDPGASKLFKQTSSQTFEEADGGPDISSPAARALWIDFDSDGDLDLSTSAGLFVNNDPSPFTKLEPGPQLDGPYFEWIDFDHDGDIDLYCLLEEPDGERYDHLYRNDGGAFTEVGEAAGLSLPYKSDQAAWGDYNRDGHPDLVVISSSDEELLLFENNGEGSFVDVTLDAGFPDLMWGKFVAMVDFNNDRDLDIICTTKEEDRPLSFLRGKSNGIFSQISKTIFYPIDFPGQSGMAWADYDNDGDLDFALANEKELALYKNNYSEGFILVTAVTDSNGNAEEEDDQGDRIAVGARVEVDIAGLDTFLPGDTLTRWVGLRTQDARIAHFGIKSSKGVYVRVTFPDGSQVTIPEVKENSSLIIRDP